MNYLRLLLPSIALAAVFAASPGAQASFPVGVWGLVDEVKLEPNGDNPSSMRIDGLFMVANTDPDFADYPGYSVPKYGYIYYTCLDKQLATCAMEWKELLAVAGTADNCRGWGDNTFKVNGTVRDPFEPMVEEQEVYPVSMGVVTGVTPCNALNAWAAENPEPEGSTGEPGSTGGTTADESAGTAGETANTSGEEATTSSATDTTTEFGGSGGPGPDSTGTTSGGSSSEGETALPVTSGSPTEGDSTTAAGSTTAASASAGETTDGGGQEKDSGCACDGAADPAQHTLAALALLAGLGLTRRRRAA
jgi:MYXO-CTERM domain-containing protein